MNNTSAGYYDCLSEAKRRLREQDATISRQAETIAHLQRVLKAKDASTAIAWRSMLGGPLTRKSE